jgi:hypothetical protein
LEELGGHLADEDDVDHQDPDGRGGEQRWWVLPDLMREFVGDKRIASDGRRLAAGVERWWRRGWRGSQSRGRRSSATFSWWRGRRDLRVLGTPEQGGKQQRAEPGVDAYAPFLRSSRDKAEGARNEVKRLLSSSIIREVRYPEWMDNTIMVKKANGKWRMCIDFTDLNKACTKDEFPLPRIYSFVDAAASSELMSLLDCYSGYHQIWMKKEDEPKTSFITHSGTYCYLRMPEGLKNAGGSFSRMTAKVLHPQIGRNVLTYVDDIIVKSTKQENHVADLQETFANFRQAGLKLNLEKCVFWLKKGKFLGCLVSTKAIEANPSKIEAILRMEPPNSKKGAQRLAGRLASFNRFISRSAERNLPFFEILKSAEVF